MVGRALFCLLLGAICSAQEQEAREVELAQGAVRGYRAADGDYFAFYGIPYATTPTGRDKYKAPLPVPTWSKTFEAVDKQIMCPQPPMKKVKNKIHENQCLIANILIPDINQTNLPVVVYVHGGAYIGGFGNMLMAKEMVAQGKYIAVTFNYRLGVHGFLCLGTENAPGNAGMKDMVALLRWVQENIVKFGGNPDDVTISGFSAGAAAADLLSFSKTTKDLFHKVILESGAAISGWGVDVDPLASAKRYASLLNFTSGNVYELEEFYLTTPLDKLVVAESGHIPDTSLPFVPCIERDTGSEIFIDDSPINILRKPEHTKRPFLTGFTEMEGRLRLAKFVEWSEIMNNNFDEFLPADLQFENKEEKESVAEKVKVFYFKDRDVSTETVQAFVDFQTDIIFAYPAIRSAKLQVQAGNNAVYLYKYSFFDDSCQSKNFEPVPIDVLGAEHCAQSRALYDTDNSTCTPAFQEMMTIMKKMWINFIRKGHPVPNGSAVIEGGWPPVSSNQTYYMELNNPIKLVSETPWEDRVKLWDDIYEKHYRAPVPPPPPPAIMTKTQP